MNLQIESIGRCNELRNAFIKKFVRTTLTEYHEHIEKKVLINGLPYYRGFLWEFVYCRGEMNSKPISEEEGLRLLCAKDTVLFMFDFFYSTNEMIERPPIPPFDSFDWKHVIYKAKASILPKLIWESWHGDKEKINKSPDGPIALPSSVYLFDESMKWFIAFTEENNDQDRICFASVN